ncbi:hydroxymethylpyrimidine/phosphomethylpyrimidine kinase [Thiospirillum jenense]|uniref:hydroxymethylpyrimidine kinase n=2 Tax=Thiospirillum jenense TaxID=1653858 RepID=A0A839HBJ6_9GAMM|nr:hydroxymethylpyrimidine/phosphomethylpyrimidine kinase [Thiospirillum jenense]
MAPADVERTPILLAIGGHDPSGGAGIQADTEAAAAAGVHCCTAITCITVQNTCGLCQLVPQRPAQVRAQCQVIMDDSRIGAIKVGLIGSSRLIQVLGELIDACPGVPVVLDPVLAAGSGQVTADAALINQLRLHLLPRCELVTPNVPEALLMSTVTQFERAAERLLAFGCKAVLLTGTHDHTSELVINRLYRPNEAVVAWEWPRLAASFHGSGCTLASAIAARLASGQSLVDAIEAAQIYVAAALNTARQTGRCQMTPRRVG